MTDACCFIGKRAYYYSHVLPAAIAHYERVGRPVALTLLDDNELLVAPYARRIERRQIREHDYAVAFDTWAMVAGAQRRVRTAYVHHSLVGKGRVFKGRKPYWPLFLADSIVVPDPARVRDLPPCFGRKAVDLGHLPLDWLQLDARSVAPELLAPLEALTGAARDAFLIACLFTHGNFGSTQLLEPLLSQAPSDVRVAVRYHGYIAPEQRVNLPALIDLGELPSTVAAAHADLVLTDHCSAAVEAAMLGKPVLCFESEALRSLRTRMSFLSELGYLRRANVALYRDFGELQALIAAAVRSGKRRGGVVPAVSWPRAGYRLAEFVEHALEVRA